MTAATVRLMPVNGSWSASVPADELLPVLGPDGSTICTLPAACALGRLVLHLGQPHRVTESHRVVHPARGGR